MRTLTGTICWQATGTHMILCMQALTISSRHIRFVELLTAWQVNLMGGAYLMDAEAVTGGEHHTSYITDAYIRAKSAAKRGREDAVSGGEHSNIPRPSTYSGGEHTTRHRLGDLHAEAELEGSTSGGEHPTGSTTLPVEYASDQPMAADAPPDVTDSSQEDSTDTETHADFSMWHPPEAHQIKAGVVFEGSEACIPELKDITPAGLEWVPADQEGFLLCIKSTDAIAWALNVMGCDWVL